MKLALIAAVARNGVIGQHGTLPWHLPEDLQFFKRTTLGCPVIMGRRTWESLPERFRPLPGRRNLVLTRDAGWHAQGAEVHASLADALMHLPGVERAFVIGGAELYVHALPLADELVLTELDQDYDGDAYFPAWRRSDFIETRRERPTAPSSDGSVLPFSFVTYQRDRGV